MNYAVIRHADGKKSKSKYQGGFKNGKNTSAYNHDYYIHNKEKWKDNNQGDSEEDDKKALIEDREAWSGKKKKYSLFDKLVGKPEYDNLKRAKEDYEEKIKRQQAFAARSGYRMQTHTATEGQKRSHAELKTYYNTKGVARSRFMLKKYQKEYDKTLHSKIEKGKAWLSKIFKDGRRK